VLEEGGFEVVYPPQGLSLKDPKTLIERLKGFDAVIASVEPYTREVFQACGLRVVSRNGVGYDSVDVQAATDLGIAVAITPGINQESVAEHTLALMLAAAHGYPARQTEACSGNWQNRTVLPRLAGKTLGLVGLGAIGKALVPKAIGVGMHVIAHDPVPDHEFAKQHGVRLCEFDQLLAESDVVSLHLPCTPETTNLIDANALARMKAGAVLVNTSRGGLVDEEALVEALQRGLLRAAALDVFKVEPLPSDSPLAHMDNVLACPHMGGTDEESLAGMAQLAARNIVDLYHGRWPEGRIVNTQIRDGWKWGRTEG
jgi:D-3-phosphoglycerate dehydrogenase/(S)-sulfolactate dehydrogenase